MGTSQMIAQKFPWERHATFVDIGCAEGALPVQLALAHEHLSGGGFDLPLVAPFFERYVGSFGLAERLDFYAGDFFSDPLPEADVLTMGHILHDWGLEEKRMLLVKGLRGPARGRGTDRLRSPDRRRAPRERLRPPDEPQHAHRNPGGFRLHRGGLPFLDERCRLP